ncbi:heterokaryon incompatibility protein (HET) domain-containing protein [Cordyceps javanica]|nr:heterokaryon incompatibility protein (HET) domain-containing protein [Cordyceps javanica]
MIALVDEATWFKKAVSSRLKALYVSEGEHRELPVLRLWKYQTVNRNPPEPKPDTLTYIVKQAKQWSSHCDARHEVCRSLSSNFTPPISLIDCKQHCLVHGLQGMRYVALSYVWGKTGRDFNLPERRYGVPLDGLPRTISDAIAVAKSLEYDFLWVDMICIDQRSNEDKLRQMAIMDQIYRSADLTIIVAAGSDCGNGIPGVSEMPRPPRTSSTIGNTMLVEEKVDAIDEVKASIWRSRGWTLQEGLLSRRRLVFTDCQMLFSCLSGQETEPREGPEFSDNVGDMVWNAESDGSSPSASTIMAQSQKDKFWDTSVLRQTAPLVPLSLNTKMATLTMDFQLLWQSCSKATRECISHSSQISCMLSGPSATSLLKESPPCFISVAFHSFAAMRKSLPGL